MTYIKHTPSTLTGGALLDPPRPAEGRIGSEADKSDFREARHQLDRVRRNNSTLQLGSSGEQVKLLQQDLNAWRGKHGLSALDVNGSFDRRTLDAVREFQRYHAIGVSDGGLIRHDASRANFGLVADGVVGPRTMRALDLENGRESLAFNEFKKVTHGRWDKSQTGHRFRWMAADAPLSADLAKLFVAVNGEKALKALEEMCARLGASSEYMLRVMGFETAWSFDPSERNPHSGATGLIQFTRGTARGLGTSVTALARMTAEEQMHYVEKYFQPYAGRLSTLEDNYLAVYYPAALGKSDDHVLYARGSAEWAQNPVFRTSRGHVTRGDVVRSFTQSVEMA